MTGECERGLDSLFKRIRKANKEKRIAIMSRREGCWVILLHAQRYDDEETAEKAKEAMEAIAYGILSL